MRSIGVGLAPPNKYRRKLGTSHAIGKWERGNSSREVEGGYHFYNDVDVDNGVGADVDLDQLSLELAEIDVYAPEF